MIRAVFASAFMISFVIALEQIAWFEQRSAKQNTP
jgi:hypothetical protein